MAFGQWCGFLSILLLLSVLWQVRQLLLLLFAAVVLANGLNELASWFQRRRLKRAHAILLAVSCLVVGALLIVALVIPPFIQQFQELVILIPESANRLIEDLRNTANRIDPGLTAALPTWQQITTQVQPLAQDLAGRGLNLFYSTLGIPLSILLLLVVSLMLLADPAAYRRGTLRCAPASYRQRLDTILAQSEQVLKNWMLTTVVSGVSVTLLTLLGLVVLQVPLALALALVAGLLAIVPNFGWLIGLLPAMAIAVLENPWKIVGVIGLYSLVHYLDNRWITPWWVGRPPQILRGILLLAQVMFASFFGLIGLLLAVPLTLVSQVLVREILVKDVLDHYTLPSESLLPINPLQNGNGFDEK